MWGLAIAWFALSALALNSFRHAKLLPPLGASPGAATQITRVSILLAARNEELRIANTVSRLLDQTDVKIELIVVNDRSTDSTGEILRSVWHGPRFKRAETDC